MSDKMRHPLHDEEGGHAGHVEYKPVEGTPDAFMVGDDVYVYNNRSGQYRKSVRVVSGTLAEVPKEAPAEPASEPDEPKAPEGKPKA